MKLWYLYHWYSPSNQDINKARSIEDALAEFFKAEYLKGANKYRCEKCKTKVEAKKQYRVDMRPNTVVLQLKRFNFQSRKISSRITFPEYLSLSEYEVNASVDSQKYELTGIVEHLGGSLYSGHYVSYVKSQGRWFSVIYDYFSAMIAWSVLANLAELETMRHTC
jgi:ubiquitin carboxyl-terminal hydrolase 36/42